MKTYKTIGILGGMGPEATAELYLRIIRIYQQEYGAVYDDDFPEIIIINVPIPDVVDNPTQNKKVESMLVAGVQKLEKAGADFIAIPCNTATYFLPAMKTAVSIPFINILEETIKEINKKKIFKMGLLATEMTIHTNMYSALLQNKEVLIADKKSQKRTTEIILNLLAGNKLSEDKKFLLNLASYFKKQGAQKIILGCTELPLLVAGKEFVDTLDILAKAIVRETTPHPSLPL